MALYYLVFGTVCLICLPLRRFHEHLNHRVAASVGIIFTAEFIVLSIGFVEALVLFSKDFDTESEFQGLRRKAILILLVDVLMKLLTTFLSIRYSEEVF